MRWRLWADKPSQGERALILARRGKFVELNLCTFDGEQWIHDADGKEETKDLVYISTKELIQDAVRAYKKFLEPTP